MKIRILCLVTKIRILHMVVRLRILCLVMKIRILCLVDESERLSDIDDVEVVGYLHNEEERRYKEILWVQMNKEYVERLSSKINFDAFEVLFDDSVCWSSQLFHFSF